MLGKCIKRGPHSVKTPGTRTKDVLQRQQGPGGRGSWRQCSSSGKYGVTLGPSGVRSYDPRIISNLTTVLYLLRLKGGIVVGPPATKHTRRSK